MRLRSPVSLEESPRGWRVKIGERVADKVHTGAVSPKASSMLPLKTRDYCHVFSGESRS